MFRYIVQLSNQPNLHNIFTKIIILLQQNNRKKQVFKLIIFIIIYMTEKKTRAVIDKQPQPAVHECAIDGDLVIVHDDG